MFFNIPQIQYKNPWVQVLMFKNMTPSPFLKFYLSEYAVVMELHSMVMELHSMVMELHSVVMELHSVVMELVW